jgi:signal transduction histidine kinase
VLQSQKLEAIGQLAAGIAHEINTPIQYIGDNLRFLKLSMESIIAVLKAYKEVIEVTGPKGDTAKKLLETEEKADLDYLLEETPRAIQQSLEGVERISNIVLSVKSFAHPGIQERVQFDINKSIESTVNVSRNAWKYVADMELKLDPNIPLVFGYPGEFNQVILNLIINAVHAIEDAKLKTGQKGKITISTSIEKDSVLITIADTGKGIPKEIQHRIFEPFFTTKDPGKGTGQGLAIAHRYIVELHKGQIYFVSEESKGTTFFVKIPI